MTTRDGRARIVDASLFSRLPAQEAVVLAGLAVSVFFQYLFQSSMGRMLGPEEYGGLISLLSVLTTIGLSANVIRTVVAKSTSEFDAQGRLVEAGAFCWAAIRFVFTVGVLIALLVVLGSGPLSSFLHISSPWPVVVVAVALIPRLLLPVAGGALQGLQKMALYGLFRASFGVFQFLFAVVLVGLGLGVMGALGALTLSISLAFLMGIFLLASTMRLSRHGYQGGTGEVLRYSTQVAIGMISLAVLVNMDVIMVKHFFSPTQAGYYSAAAILSRLIYLLSATFGIVMFPKTSQGSLFGQDLSSIVRKTLALAVGFCTIFTLVYFLLPSPLIRFVFGPQYQVNKWLLGLLALAMSVYSLVHVWVNYYLSTRQKGFVYVLLLGAVAQIVALARFHSTLLQVASVLVANGCVLFLAGVLIFVLTSRRSKGKSNLPIG